MIANDTRKYSSASEYQFKNQIKRVKTNEDKFESTFSKLPLCISRQKHKWISSHGEQNNFTKPRTVHRCRYHRMWVFFHSFG